MRHFDSIDHIDQLCPAKVWKVPPQTQIRPLGQLEPKKSVWCRVCLRAQLELRGTSDFCESCPMVFCGEDRTWSTFAGHSCTNKIN